MTIYHIFSLIIVGCITATIYITLGLFIVDWISTYLETKNVNFPTWAKVLVFIFNPIVIFNLLLVSILSFLLKKLNPKDFQW